MAVSLPPFLRTRTGVIAVIVIAILIIVAIIAATWVYTPNIYTGLGLRHDTSLESYVDALRAEPAFADLNLEPLSRPRECIYRIGKPASGPRGTVDQLNKGIRAPG